MKKLILASLVTAFFIVAYVSTIKGALTTVPWWYNTTSTFIYTYPTSTNIEVGIGTDRPSSTLHVVGGTSTLQAVIFTNASGTNLTSSGFLQGATLNISGQSTLASATSTNLQTSGYLTVGGALNVSGQTSLASASGTNIEASGYLRGASLRITGQSDLTSVSSTNLLATGYGNFDTIDSTVLQGATSTGWEWRDMIGNGSAADRNDGFYFKIINREGIAAFDSDEYVMALSAEVGTFSFPAFIINEPGANNVGYFGSRGFEFNTTLDANGTPLRDSGKVFMNSGGGATTFTLRDASVSFNQDATGNPFVAFQTRGANRTDPQIRFRSVNAENAATTKATFLFEKDSAFAGTQPLIQIEVIDNVVGRWLQSNIFEIQGGITASSTNSTSTFAGRAIIGSTSTPSSTLHVAGDFIVTASSTFRAHVNSTGTIPTVSACGTTPSIVGTDTAGRVTTGSGVVASCLITFAQNYKSPPVCTATEETALVALDLQTTSSTLTIQGTAIDSDVIHYICISIDG